jgi:hypothetical protein
MKSMSIPILVLVLMAGFAVWALAAPDFSGTWVLDPSKSDQMQMPGGRGGGGGPQEIVIKQADNELTVTRTFQGNPFETKYVLDGAEHTVTSQRGDLKYKAAWSGDTLTISGTRTTQRGEMPMKEQYSLSDEGKVLTIASTRVGPQGEQVFKQVYNKK